MGAASDTFVIGDLPQLRLIAWHRDPADMITGEEAFGRYEQNWRFVDEAALIPREKAVITHLMRDYGNGILHV